MNRIVTAGMFICSFVRGSWYMSVLLLSTAIHTHSRQDTPQESIEKQQLKALDPSRNMSKSTHQFPTRAPNILDLKLSGSIEWGSKVNVWLKVIGFGECISGFMRFSGLVHYGFWWVYYRSSALKSISESYNPLNATHHCGNFGRSDISWILIHYIALAKYCFIKR